MKMIDKPTFKVGDVVEVIEGSEIFQSIVEHRGHPNGSLVAKIVAIEPRKWPYRILPEDESLRNRMNEDGAYIAMADELVCGASDLVSYTSRMIDFMSTQQRNFFETSIRPFVRAILFRHAPEAKTIYLERTGHDGRTWLGVDAHDQNNEALPTETTLRRVVIELSPFTLPYLNDGETLVLTSIDTKGATGSDE